MSSVLYPVSFFRRFPVLAAAAAIPVNAILVLGAFSLNPPRRLILRGQLAYLRLQPVIFLFPCGQGDGLPVQLLFQNPAGRIKQPQISVMGGFKFLPLFFRLIPFSSSYTGFSRLAVLGLPYQLLQFFHPG